MPTASREWLNQLVSDALMVSLDMVVSDELGYRPTKMPFPQQDHPIKALFLDRPNESLHARCRWAPGTASE
jgi:hypothetical protein